MKTSELTGAALDWAVAKCEGKVFDLSPDGYYTYKPSRNWALGGPIIERESISIYPDESDDMADVEWAADSPEAFRWGGPTPLIAAMRCHVASRLGDDVTVPDGLV
jgi:hypothetical protein